MKVRILAGLISVAGTQLILTACHNAESTGTITAVPTTLSKIGADPVSVPIGASFSDSIRVLVTDASNHPKSRVSVGFAVTAGGGNVTPAVVTTDAEGKAAAKFITGTTAGANVATATVVGLTPVTFSTNTVAPPPPLLWSSVPSGTTAAAAHLKAVFGFSESDVWAVGSTGYGAGYGSLIVHYDGAAWSVRTETISQGFFESVWGASASDVWAVGGANPGSGGSLIAHYDGTSWSGAASVTPAVLSSVWGSSASNIWTVGQRGAILHYDGSVWSSVASGTTEALAGVWGTSASEVWAVGDNGTILRYNGTAWSAVPSGTTQNLRSIWGSSPSDVWAVGSSSSILHYDGSNWSLIQGSQTVTGGWGYTGVWGSLPFDVWAVGNSPANPSGYSAVIIHYNGYNWSSAFVGARGPDGTLAGIWGSSSSAVWAAGGDGHAILHGSPVP